MYARWLSQMRGLAPARRFQAVDLQHDVTVEGRTAREAQLRLKEAVEFKLAMHS